MASNKRSFSTFQTNQKNVSFPSSKKQKMHHHNNNNNNKNKNKRQRKKYKNKNKNNDFFNVRFKEPDDFDKEKAHCLTFRKLIPIMQENHLYYLIKTELNKWYEFKNSNKNANKVLMNGAIDIHLYHNRQKSSLPGFAYIYFENKSDASYILQLSQQKLLKYLNHSIFCEWKLNQKDNDNYSEIYQTNIDKKSETKLIKITNLHWKTTLFHLYNLFKTFKCDNDDNKDGDIDIDFEPRWIKVYEDKNGYPKSMALVMLKTGKNVIYFVDKLQNYRLFGRKLKFEYSCYNYEGSLFTKYNESNLQLAGLSSKLLLSNLKSSVKLSDIHKFLDKFGYDKNVFKDIYLFHNLDKVCPGKCFIEFDNEANCTKYLDILQFKQLCNRTVIVEYGHLHNDYDDDGARNSSLRGETNRLFISNLAWDVKEKDIHRLFGDKLTINNIHFNIHASGFPKGSAFITFQDFNICEKAMDKAKGKQIKNRVVSLDFASIFKIKPVAFNDHYDNDNNNDQWNNDY